MRSRVGSQQPWKQETPCSCRWTKAGEPVCREGWDIGSPLASRVAWSLVSTSGRPYSRWWSDSVQHLIKIKKKKRQHARTRNSSFLLKFPSSTLCWQNLILCFLKRKKRSVSHSVMFYSLQPHELKTARLLFFFFSRQDYWSGKLLPSSGDLPNPGIKLRYLALQVDSLPSESPGKSHWRGDRLKASLLRHRRTPGGAGAERQRTDKWPESHLSSGTKTE